MDDKQLGRVEAIINSMTHRRAAQPRAHQRQPPQADRASGSGTSVEEVNRLLKQFVEMRKMLKTMGGDRRRASKGAKQRADGDVETAGKRQLGRKLAGGQMLVIRIAAGGIEESAVLPHRRDRERVGARRPVRRGDRALQSAHEAGDARARSRAAGALAEGRRAAVRHGAHADRSHAGGAGGATDETAGRVVSRARDVVEVVAQALAGAARRGRRHGDRAARHRPSSS